MSNQSRLIHLFVDLHGEDALAVEDLDGEGGAGVGVARQLHLAEVPLSQRPPHLVLPHPHCRRPPRMGGPPSPARARARWRSSTLARGEEKRRFGGGFGGSWRKGVRLWEFGWVFIGSCRMATLPVAAATGSVTGFILVFCIPFSFFF